MATNINTSDMNSAVAKEKISMFDGKLLKPAIMDSFKKLSPQTQWRNPVMFVVYLGSLLTIGQWLAAMAGHAAAPAG